MTQPHPVTIRPAISECGTWRYRLDREVQAEGIVIAYFGVNGSTATHLVDDQTSRKWTGFTRINNGRRYIAGNPYAYRATDVRELAKCPDPVGPENAIYLDEMIGESDLLVPCWGNINKVPLRIRHHIFNLARRLLRSEKPVKVFGLTKSGDPMHPLMLPYSTQLINWTGYP